MDRGSVGDEPGCYNQNVWWKWLTLNGNTPRLSDVGFLKALFKYVFQDSPTNKLLYAKEIPEYKKRVQLYYQQIQEMSPLSEQEMNAHLAEESRVSQVFRTCVRHALPAPWNKILVPRGGLKKKSVFYIPQKYRNEFNTNLALTEIYKYAKRYRNQVREVGLDVR